MVSSPDIELSLDSGVGGWLGAAAEELALMDGVRCAFVSVWTADGVLFHPFHARYDSHVLVRGSVTAVSWVGD